MAAKMISYGSEARARMLRGVSTLANAVRPGKQVGVGKTIRFNYSADYPQNPFVSLNMVKSHRSSPFYSTFSKNHYPY